MSYTPPPPPEVPPNPNRPQTMPPNAPSAQYAPSEAAPPGTYAPIDPSGYPPVYGYGYPPPQQPVPTSSGCRWGCITFLVAVFAVVFLIGAVLVSLLSSGANAFGGFGDTLGNLLGGWAHTFGPPAARVIVLPEVDRLQKLARVTTVKFNYAGVVTVRQDVPPLLAGLYGNEKVLVAVVSVQAGIDLSTLKPEDYVYDEATNTLTLHLPAPALQECFMDDSKSYVVENKTGVFVGASPELDDTARRYAIQQFREQAQEEKILDEAQSEAQTVISDFISALNPSSGPTIQFDFTAPDPNAVLPPTCQ
jgi:hypothetical protein